MCLYVKLQADVEIKIPASKFHEMVLKRPHHISNASSDKVQGCELHEGDWGKVGSIICWDYFHDGKAKVEKDLIEVVDKEKNLITYKVIEGDLLELYKTCKFTMQAISNGKGSVVHLILEYEKFHEDIPDSYTYLELCVGITKDIEAHFMKDN